MIPLLILFFLSSPLTIFSAEKPTREEKLSQEIAKLKNQLESETKLYEEKITSLMAIIRNRDTIIEVQKEIIKRLESDEPRISIGKFEQKNPKS